MSESLLGWLSGGEDHDFYDILSCINNFFLRGGGAQFGDLNTLETSYVSLFLKGYVPGKKIFQYQIQNNSNHQDWEIPAIRVIRNYSGFLVTFISTIVSLTVIHLPPFMQSRGETFKSPMFRQRRSKNKLC